MNDPRSIILHHSATADGKVLSSYEAIERYHTQTKGWSDIGYHLLLEYVNNKLVWRQGRDFKTSGAHTVGRNHDSIGICVVGNFDKDIFNQDHINAVLAKQRELEKLYNRKLPIEFHRDYSSKTCPGTNVSKDMFKYLYSDISDRPTEAIQAIEWATSQGLLKGYPDGTFKPTEPVTREELAIILYRKSS